MNWKNHFLNSNGGQTETYELYLPVSDSDLQELKIEFGLNELPNELEELYKQTNGVGQLLDIEPDKKELIGYLIWTIERVIETNKEFRNYPDFKNLYMSFDQLLFFSDAGNGDLFGFVVLNGLFDRQDIFVWNHEDDSRTWVAPNLTTFIEWWRDGKISV